MGEHRRITALGIALAFVLGSAPLGCRGSKGKKSGEPLPALPASTESAKPPQPVDKVLPGEVAEGPESAFGLALPKGMRVSARFPDAVFAEGDIEPTRVANYVRDRVNPERVETGPSKTVFTRAALKAEVAQAAPLLPEPEAPPSPPAKTLLHIEVIAKGGETSIVVRDETRRAAKEGLTEEERWRELGLTKDGEPLDPTQLE